MIVYVGEEKEEARRPEEIQKNSRVWGSEIPGVPLGGDKGHGATQEITDV